MNLTYIAMGPNCWGRGGTIEEAIKKAKTNWPSFYKHGKPTAKNFSVWSTEDNKAFVDEMGRVVSKSELTKLQTSALAD